MSEDPHQADDLILSAISTMSKARVLAKTSKRESAQYLYKAIDIFKEAINKNPHDYSNRIQRARHIFEASNESPYSFIGIVEEDIEFIDSNFHLLNDAEKCRYNNLKAEYLINKGEVEKGKNLLRTSVRLSPDSIIGDYAKKLLEIL